jgi:dTDP-4-amino-4,6-dideoxygalactose transaminase
MTTLAEDGITTRPLWRPVSGQRPYAGCRRWGGEIAEQLAAEGLSLPCSASLSVAAQEHVIAALERALKRVAAA